MNLTLKIHIIKMLTLLVSLRLVLHQNIVTIPRLYKPQEYKAEELNSI